MREHRIQADYSTAKHIPTRSIWQLIIEIPEEDYPIICAQIGFPISGEGIPVEIKKYE